MFCFFYETEKVLILNHLFNVCNSMSSVFFSELCYVSKGNESQLLKVYYADKHSMLDPSFIVIQLD